jgi:hypothetical protein
MNATFIATAMSLAQVLDPSPDPDNDCCALDAVARFAPATYDAIAHDHDDDLQLRDILSHGAGCHFCG